MKPLHGFSILLFCAISVSSGCRRTADYNYEHTLTFFREVAVHGHLNEARRKHLESIAPSDLHSPIVFLCTIIKQPPSNGWPDWRGTVFLFWSEDRFRKYQLAIKIENSLLATISAVYTSQESDGQKENFDFVVHDAMYPLSLSELLHIVNAYNQGKQVHLTLRHPSENKSSQPISWEQVHRTTQESWSRSGNCWETALDRLLQNGKK